MSVLILAPHHDDVALFSAFNAIRHRAHVVVVFRSVKQEALYGITHEEREAEERAALSILGCTFEQWEFPDDDPDWRGVEMRVASWQSECEHYFVPVVELIGGNGQHSEVGNLAYQTLDRERVTSYLTYTQRGKSDWGKPVEYEPDWVPLKLRALACYRSQMRTNAAEHFMRGLHEYVA